MKTLIKTRIKKFLLPSLMVIGMMGTASAYVPYQTRASHVYMPTQIKTGTTISQSGSIVQALNTINATLEQQSALLQAQQKQIKQLSQTAQSHTKIMQTNAHKAAQLNQAIWHHYVAMQAQLNYPSSPMPSWLSALNNMQNISISAKQYAPQKDFMQIVCTYYPHLIAGACSNPLLATFNTAQLFSHPKTATQNHYTNDLTLALTGLVNQSQTINKSRDKAQVELSAISAAKSALNSVQTDNAKLTPSLVKATQTWLNHNWQNTLTHSNVTQSNRAIAETMAENNVLLFKLYQQNLHLETLMANVVSQLVQLNTKTKH